jgi:hypothetical protein
MLFRVGALAGLGQRQTAKMNGLRASMTDAWTATKGLMAAHMKEKRRLKFAREMWRWRAVTWHQEAAFFSVATMGYKLLGHDLSERSQKMLDDARRHINGAETVIACVEEEKKGVEETLAQTNEAHEKEKKHLGETLTQANEAYETEKKGLEERLTQVNNDHGEEKKRLEEMLEQAKEAHRTEKMRLLGEKKG